MMLSSHDDYAVQNLYHTLGPVADVIRAYPNALELAVNRPGEVQVELDNGTWLGVEAPNVTADTLHSMALAVAKHTAQSFNERNAVLFGTLPGGERLTFVGPPITAPGIVSLTMRLVRNTIRTMSAYDGSDFFDSADWLNRHDVLPRLDELDAPDAVLVNLLQHKHLRDFLLMAVRLKRTIGVVGDTGSGKTFLMESLIQTIPTDERLLTIESARELQLPNHPNKVQLAYSHFGTGASALDAAGLSAVTKRMKPSRVLLGECIGKESFTFLDLILSGHPGSLTSWHAISAKLAAQRFVLMCRQHPDAQPYSPPELLNLFALAVDVIVHIAVERTADANAPKRRWISDITYNPLRAKPAVTPH
jgi:type IV secretion system protein VirB11